MTSYKQPTKSRSIQKSPSNVSDYKNKTVTLGNYKIQKKSIGRGSFSKIYIGTSMSTGEQIAVKIIKKCNVKNENNILREIKIMSMIKHQNILGLLDVLVSNNKYYLIMEYCDMGDLKEYMKHRDLNEKELIYYMTQIRDGIWELHKNNIIHRDLKPQNILVTNDDCLKISDFGFAKSYNPDTDLQQTMCGSPLYMAPEILEQKRYTDTADLWSVGVIMYELYFNEVPVKGVNIVDLIKNIRLFKFQPTNTKSNKCSSNCLKSMDMLLKVDTKKRCSWDEFYNNPWFTQKDMVDQYNNQKSFNIDVGTEHNLIIQNKNKISLNDQEDEDGPDFCMFNMDEDANVLYRSNVQITDNYLENEIEKHELVNSYIEDEYFDDNYVIITSPSEMDIYSQNHVKSFDTHECDGINQTEKRSVKYVRMKRIFNSLKDSISYMFRAKSI
jgi:serine/threonine protein kinase